MSMSVQPRAVICAAVCSVGLIFTSGQARISAQEPPSLLQLRVVVQGPAPDTDWEFAHEALGVSTFLPAAGTETFMAYPAGQWRLAQIPKANYRTSVACEGASWEALAGQEVRIEMPASGLVLCSYTNTFEQQADATPTDEPPPADTATPIEAQTVTTVPSTAQPGATVHPTRAHKPTKTPHPTKLPRPTKTMRPTKTPKP